MANCGVFRAPGLRCHARRADPALPDAPRALDQRTHGLGGLVACRLGPAVGLATAVARSGIPGSASHRLPPGDSP
jgi:hypothetical protein